MIKWKYHDVPLDKIQPIFCEHTSKTGLRKKIKVLKKGHHFALVMIVEKDKKEDLYYLIAGYPEYEAYNKFNTENRQTMVPCFVQGSTDYTTQRIILLQRMFTLQKTDWTDKFRLIKDLLDKKLSISEIAEKAGVDKSDLKKYLFHPDVPEHIVKKALENKGSLQTINDIHRLEVHIKIKKRLYNLAVKRQRDEERLTIDKMEKIKWLIKLEHFEDLTNDKKWAMIERALSFKKVLEHVWQEEITQLMNSDGED